MGTRVNTRSKPRAGGKPARRAAPRRTGLADALFSRTQQRVLALLFGQPARSFFATELIGLVGAGSGAVQRELQRLAESGLVVVTRVGNQKHYQANRAAPIFAELCGIVEKTVGLVEPLRSGLATLGDRIHLALVFGSVARHTDGATSDVDLLVVADDLILEDLYSALEPVERRLGRKITPTLYTQAEYERRRKGDHPFLKRVLNGEHLWLMGEQSLVPASTR